MLSWNYQSMAYEGSKYVWKIICKKGCNQQVSSSQGAPKMDKKAVSYIFDIETGGIQLPPKKQHLYLNLYLNIC